MSQKSEGNKNEDTRAKFWALWLPFEVSEIISGKSDKFFENSIDFC